MNAILSARKIAPDAVVWAVTALVYLGGAVTALSMGEVMAMCFFFAFAVGTTVALCRTLQLPESGLRDPCCVTTRARSIVSTLPRSDAGRVA